MAYIPGNKIGEYVHYKYENYLRYGLARKLSTAPSSVQGSLSKYVYEAREQASSIVSSNINRAALLKAQAGLNFLMGKSATNGEESATQRRELVRRSLTEVLQTKVKSLDVSDIDWSNLTLKHSGIEKIKAANIDFSKMLTELEQLYPSTPTKDIAKKMLKISTLKNDITGDNADHYVGAFIRRANNLRAAINSLDLDQTTIENLNTKISALTNGAQIKGRTTGKFTDATLYTELVNIANEVLVACSIVGIEGFLAEGAAASLGAVFAKEVGKNAKRLVEENIVGPIKKEKNVFISNSFMSGINIDTVMTDSHYKKAGDGITWELTSGVEGKIDAVVNLDDSQLKASVKNYNLSGGNPHIKGVTLVSGSSMLFLLSNQIRFLNHYLNQTVDTAPSNVVVNANKEMKLMLLLLSFIGGGMRKGANGQIYQNRADTFIINDKSKPGSIRVVSIYELYEKIIQSNNPEISITLDDTHTWKNTKIGNNPDPALANQRISNILAQVHKKKITASIGFNTMNSALANIK